MDAPGDERPWEATENRERKFRATNHLSSF